jgi:hypothetical protein
LRCLRRTHAQAAPWIPKQRFEGAMRKIQTRRCQYRESKSRQLGHVWSESPQWDGFRCWRVILLIRRHAFQGSPGLFDFLIEFRKQRWLIDIFPLSHSLAFAHTIKSRRRCDTADAHCIKLKMRLTRTCCLVPFA